MQAYDSADRQRECITRYTIAEGDWCSQDRECAGTLACDGSTDTCKSPSLEFLGQGCTSANDCGRDLGCACPPAGGGRRQCFDAETPTQAKRISEWPLIMPYYACLDEFKCKFDNLDTTAGTSGEIWHVKQGLNANNCAYANCRNKFPTQTPPQLCSTPLLSEAASTFAGAGGVVRASAATLTVSSAASVALVVALGCVAAALVL
jgi:hypothetical protein